VQSIYVRTSTRTLAEYLRAEWLPATAPPRVRHETWDDRRRNLENHVISRIGEVTLQQLTAAHRNRLYGELLAEDGSTVRVGCHRPRSGASTRCCARPSTTPSAGGCWNATSR